MTFKSILKNWCEESAVVASAPAANSLQNGMFDITSFFIPSHGRNLSEIPNGKLVVFGLPKSGNVWLVSMLCDYFAMESIDPVVDVAKPGIGMCHLPFGEEITSRLDFIHGVYLLRDLRDVVVSYFHNCQTEWFKRSMPNFHYEDMESFYFEWFVPRVVPFHGVADHANTFARAGLPVVRYEKLCDQPIEEFSRLLKRLGVPLDDRRIVEVVNKNSFDQLKKNGRQLNVFVPSTHFRRGGSGAYKDELPTSVLRHLTETYRSALFDWGYEISDQFEPLVRDRSKAE
jgi:hypothetical protein